MTLLPTNYFNRFIPPMKVSARPHMVLPTQGRYNGVFRILMLLNKLGIVTNRESLHIPSWSPGVTYYHEPE